MLNYDTLKKNRRKFLALTGITPKEFKLLLPAFVRASQRLHPPRLTRRGHPRQRRAEGGRKSVLQRPEQQLLFGLVYQKAYPLQVLLGEVFDLSQSRVNAWVRRLLPVLKLALDEMGVTPERNPRAFRRRERQQAASLDLIIDGTERRRQRPKNPEKQAAHYSGKKKAHSDKNLVIVNAKSKRIGYLSKTYVGKTHDKAMADSEAIVYPAEATLHKDSGFQG